MALSSSTFRWVRPWLLTVVGVLTICHLVVCSSSTALGADDLEARRQEIAAMSPAEQQELLRRQERFLALPQDEQNRLRALQAAIDADPKADRLRQVLAGYHEWLKTRSPGERAELAKLSRPERVEAIRRSVRYQQITRRLAENFELLTSRDMRNILDWIEDLLWHQRDELIASTSPSMRAWFERQSDERQRRALLHVAVGQWRHAGSGKKPVSIQQEDIQKLSENLSDEAQAELAKRNGLEEQRRLVGGWIFSSMNERSDFGRSSRRSAPLPEADVAEFFESELSAGKRDELMSLSPSKARQELRRMYWRRDRGESMFRGGPAAPRPDRRHPQGFDRDRPPHDGKSFDSRRGPPRKKSGSPPHPPERHGEPDGTSNRSTGEPEF